MQLCAGWVWARKQGPKAVQWQYTMDLIDLALIGGQDAVCGIWDS